MAANKLTESMCRRAKVGRHADGKGLILRVYDTGAKTWYLRYQRDGRDTAATLGHWPEMSLADARAAADAARTQRREGIDPVKGARRRVQHKTPTFEAVAEAYIASRTGWSKGHRERFVNRMRLDVFPEMGWTPIDKITAQEVVWVADAIIKRGAMDTAKRVVAMIGQVLRYSIIMGHGATDVTHGLAPALGDSPPVQHRPAVTTTDGVRELWQRMQGYEGADSPALRLLQLLLLTAQRSGDVRRMTWDAIDGSDWHFTIGKTQVPHVVPLSDQVQAVLARCPRAGPYVIGGQRVVTDVLPSRMLDRLGYEKGQITAHGFRASFRTICAEQLGARDEVLAAHLGHVPASAHGRAYNRTTFIEERRALMAQWAALVSGS